MAASNKTYLGDGVYAEMGEFGIKLTTEDGISVTNTVILEPEVYAHLKAWVTRELNL